MMTQEEFKSQFISRSALCALLGRSLNYLTNPIEQGKVPPPLAMKSAGDKMFYLYEKEVIFNNEFIKKQLGDLK